MHPAIHRSLAASEAARTAGQLEVALAHAEKAIAFVESPSHNCSTVDRVGCAYVASGLHLELHQLAPSLDLVDHALVLAAGIVPPDSRHNKQLLARLHLARGRTLAEWDRFTEANAAYDSALLGFESISDGTSIVHTLSVKVEYLCRVGQITEALDALDRASAIVSSGIEVGPGIAMQLIFLKGTMLFDANRFPESLVALDTVLSSVEKAYGRSCE